jgi:hypothetical protein
MHCYALRHLPYDLDRTSSTIIKLHIDAASPSDAILPRLAFCADTACFRATSSASCYHHRLRVVQYWVSSPRQGLPFSLICTKEDLRGWKGRRTTHGLAKVCYFFPASLLHDTGTHTCIRRAGHDDDLRCRPRLIVEILRCATERSATLKFESRSSSVPHP